MGESYPMPVVEHSQQRALALEIYKTAATPAANANP